VSPAFVSIERTRHLRFRAEEKGKKLFKQNKVPVLKLFSVRKHAAAALTAGLD